MILRRAGRLVKGDLPRYVAAGGTALLNLVAGARSHAECVLGVARVGPLRSDGLGDCGHGLGIVCGALAAQSSVTTVRGVAFDSLRGQPLAGALIELSGSTRMVIADRRGAFRLDSVPLGPQRLTFSSPALDSIGLFGFAVDVASMSRRRR